jgi:predicted secreted protein
VKYSKPIAWLVFLVFTWLAFGASSLHQKDVAAGIRETAPAYHSIQTPLVLGTIALLAVLFALFAKVGTNAPTRVRL